MPDASPQPHCFACQRTSDETPLIPLEFRGVRLWICPQHMPALIHDPEQVTDRLAEAIRDEG